MKIRLILLMLVAFLGLPSNRAAANWLVVSNVSYVLGPTSSTVTFNLSWNNSWRINPSIQPANWDAAWVFVKFRECGVDPTVQWEHGLVSTMLSDHSFPSGTPGLEPTLSNGSAVGIDPAPNNTGVMLRRTQVGHFPAVAAQTITLRITNLNHTSIPSMLADVKVFGIEMVFIPQGPFWLGDGNTGPVSCDNSFIRRYVDSETFAPSSLLPCNSNTIGAGITLGNNYPKGFKPFYLMKYEISEGQYIDFLNTLAFNQAMARHTGNTTFRHTISSAGPPPNIFTSLRPNRACNWLRFTDVASYLDWAALRPMTELEFEKACRGPMPIVSNEYAWGTASITPATTIQTTSPTENGTELILDNPPANCNYNNTTFSGGDAAQGPLRVGIFSTSSTNTRQLTGAGYYGNMELSGNVWEWVIAASNGTSCGYSVTNYDGHWGDGYLTATGLHNVTNWPPPDCATLPTAGNAYIGLRGGAWNQTILRHMSTSNRIHCHNIQSDASNAAGRFASTGGRGAR